MASASTGSSHDVARTPDPSGEPLPVSTNSVASLPHDPPTPVSGDLPGVELPQSRALLDAVAGITHVDPSQTSLVSPQGGARSTEPAAVTLASEIGQADLHISADGCFVQTSSALAARELKKAYDQILREKLGTQGVVRSPYAITAVKDASGGSVFRIGYRESSMDTADAADMPSESSPYSPGHAVGPRRKARLSVHDFLPSSMFKPTGSGSTPPRNTSPFSMASGSIPHTGMRPSTYHMSRNKLRRQRSNSDLHLRGTNNPPYAGSNPSGDGVVPVSPRPRSENFAIEIRDEITAGADAFSQVLAWSSELVMDSVPPSRKSSKASAPPAEVHLDSLAPATTPSNARRPSISTSVALSTSTCETWTAPFGENVRYTAPTRRSAIFLAPKAPQLREMQSFESGLTARASDDKDVSPGTPKSKSPPLINKETDGAFLAAKSQARFSTSVFGVLQTYRGLPLPSALSELSTGATIKLSTTDSATPKDDPRFVIWGELMPDGPIVDDSSVSHSQSSHTDLSASTSSAPGSRKRSNTRPPQSNNDISSPKTGSEITPKTVIIAATVERWIAQLTSELNYDELLNFLLTYRTYITPVDLCHLLICRFHWALEPPTSRQDDMVRRIVRVRTFIAMRYWLLTFFREDFLPNAELCQLFASWLNALFRDPALEKHADALSIVRKLKKIVRECKAAHSRHWRSGLGRPSADIGDVPYTSLNGAISDLERGSTIEAPCKKAESEKVSEEIDDSDVDLDFSREAIPGFATGEITLSSLHEVISSSDEPTLARPTASGPPVQNRASATPSANSILLSQPLSKVILGHVKSTTPGTDTPFTQHTPSLPIQHSAISRAFVNTIGRLGRWKRVLNSRSNVPASHCGDVSAFDLELNATGDLLFVHGGVEQYLKMLNLSPPIHPGLSPQVENSRNAEVTHPTRPPGLEPAREQETDVAQKRKSLLSNVLQLDVLDEENEDPDQGGMRQAQEEYSHHNVLSATSNTDDTSANHLSSDISTPSGWAPDIVSLDDYDLSDSSSSSHSAPRVRKLPRRLPLRRDFQFVRRSIDTVSSMGIRSRSSFASSVNSGQESASISVRPMSRGSAMSEDHPFVTGIKSWQIQLIDTDDEDEAGDAEAALRRLEGQIDADRQREKDLKVGRWLRTAHQRERDRDSASNSVHSDSLISEPEPETEARDHVEHEPKYSEDVTVSVQSVRSSVAETASVVDTTALPTVDSSRTIVGGSAAAVAPVSSATSARDRSGSVDSVQMSSPSSTTSRRPSLLGRGPRGPSSKFGAPNVPISHRSFILVHRSETLAQQFAIIEAELFAKIKFEELISHQWGQSPEDVNVKDWTQFVKERARLKNAEQAAPDRSVRAKLSAILALRARFDLLVNFVASEILLTHANERVIVVEKFIRIAWKTYLHNNFSSLVALIAGLQTRWVNLAMSRLWHRVAMWEQRLFDDLRKFTARTGEFKYLRNATAVLVDAGPLSSASQGRGNITRSMSSGSTKPKAVEVRAPPACVPFLGMYLAQLYEHEKLPDFVDPTVPTEPVLIDPESGNLSSPAHPDVFSNLQPLPKDLDLEPLINVHKQRLIADVIKSFVAGQHLATNIRFAVDQKSWQKCFRLRSLESDALHSIIKSLPES